MFGVLFVLIALGVGTKLLANVFGAFCGWLNETWHEMQDGYRDELERRKKQ